MFRKELSLKPTAFFLLLVLGAPALPATSPQEVRAIAERAYTFAYPMVLMEFTRRNALERPSVLGLSETNRFTHAPQFPDHRFHQVIRPNADTLYSSSWLDLSKEPVLLHISGTHDRYFLMQFLDAWTETFASPGKRTTGTGDSWFAIVGPGWKGTLPARAQRIDSPTNMAWLIGRTQTNNAGDYANVHAIQRGYMLMPLSLYPDGPRASRPAAAAPPATPFVPPPVQVQQLSPVEFFRIFADLLARNPPHPDDQPMLQQLARIGILPGKPFDSDALGAEGLKALEEGARSMSNRLAAFDGRAGQPNKTGWTGFGMKVGRYGTDYTARAFVARIGLGALPPEDAVYVNCHQDSEAHPLDGAHRYRIHFDKGQTPPVRAFWSVTMYGDDGYFVKNPINRFAIGDRDPLQFNPDGSLDLYLQHDAPGGAKDANWLPAPEAAFNLSLRMYWPQDEVLNGQWIPPAVVREKER